jgi:hypothetical protein
VDSAVGKGTVFRLRLPTREKRARVLEAPSRPGKLLEVTEES